MARENNLSDLLGDIAESIREKTGKTEQINAQDFPEEILGIQSGEDVTEEVTAQVELLDTLNTVIDEFPDKPMPKSYLLDLPSQFANATGIYWVQVNEDKFLISSNLNNIGVWVYSVSAGTLSQKYTTGSAWQYFQVLSNGTKCLIGSQPTYQTLLYDATNNTITNIKSVGFKYPQVIGEDCLYSNDTSTSGVTTSGGLFRFNGSDNTVDQLHNMGSQLSYYIKAGNKYLISSNSGNEGSLGVFVYDTITRTLRRETQTASGDMFTLAGWQFSYEINNKCFLSGTNQNQGVLVYNIDSDTFDYLYKLGNRWNNYQPIGNNVLITSSSTGGTDSAGILLYDNDLSTISRVFDTGLYYTIFKVFGNKCMISSTNYSYAGIIIYDNISKTASKKYNYGYNWVYSQQVGDDLIISTSVTSGSTTVGVMLYRGDTDTVSVIYTYGVVFKNFNIIGNKVLMSSALTSNYCLGILSYDTTTHTATRITQSGYNYDKVTQDGTDYYFETTDKSLNRRRLKYDSLADTIKLVGYYVEAV